MISTTETQSQQATKTQSIGINEIAAFAALGSGWLALILLAFLPSAAFGLGSATIFFATRGIVHSKRKTTALLGLLPAMVAIFLSAGPTFLR